MKELYSYEYSLPDSEEKVTVFLKKPNAAEIEDAEFAYSQKFNRLLHQGFLSRSMMDKRFGDIGGMYSEKNVKDLSTAIEKLIDAQRIIEFFEGAEGLTNEQIKELEDARETFVNVRFNIASMDRNLEDMYNQSADAKADNHMIKWLVLNNSYYYATVTKGENSKKEAFPLFEGQTFEEKLKAYNSFLDEIEETDSADLTKKKKIIEGTLVRLSRVMNLWKNNLGKNQEELEKAYEEYFPTKKVEKPETPLEEAEEEVPQKRGRKKVNG